MSVIIHLVVYLFVISQQWSNRHNQLIKEKLEVTTFCVSVQHQLGDNNAIRRTKSAVNCISLHSRLRQDNRSSRQWLLSRRFVKQVDIRMYFRSGTDGNCCVAAGQTLCVRSTGGSTVLCEITSWPLSWNYDVKPKIRLQQSMHLYSKNNPNKFHPDPVWNHGTLGFFWRGRPNKNKMSSERRAVPDLKTL